MTKYVMKFTLGKSEIEPIVLAYLEDILPNFEGQSDICLKKDYKALKRVIEVVKA